MAAVAPHIPPPGATNETVRVNRLRVEFSKGPEVKFISHLDLVRAWTRIIRRAGLPLTYSQGFSPHPQLIFALPLQVGVIGERELMDVYFDEPIYAERFQVAVSPELPGGIKLVDCWNQNEGVSLPKIVRAAEYSVSIETDDNPESLRSVIAALLDRPSIPWEKAREGKTKQIDLRPLIHELTLAESGGGAAKFTMKLVSDNTRAARPDDVVGVLGYGDAILELRRTGLVFSQPIR